MLASSNRCAAQLLRNRSTSRAQRYVFEQSLHELPVKVQKQYRRCKDPAEKMAGKTKAANKIINMYVSRSTSWKGSLKPKEATIAAVLEKTNRDVDRNQKFGMSKNVMIGKIFAGNKQLFAEALAEDEVWEENGKWYHDEHHVAKSKEIVGSTIGTKTSDVPTDKFNSAMAALMDIQPSMDEDWMRSSTIPGKKTPCMIDNLSATDNDFLVLQESFDSVTRVTCAIRAVAVALGQCGGMTKNADMMAKRGVQLCKDVVPSQERVEEILIKGRTTISKESVQKTLQDAAGPYRNLVTFYNELLAVYQLHAKASSSGSAAKFKLPAL